MRRSRRRGCDAGESAGPAAHRNAQLPEHGARRRIAAPGRCARAGRGLPAARQFPHQDRGRCARTRLRTACPRPGTRVDVEPPARKPWARSSATSVHVGNSALRLAALVVQEPDAALDYFNGRRPRCSSTSATCRPPAWCRKAAASAIDWSWPVSRRRSSNFIAQATPAAWIAASAWKPRPTPGRKSARALDRAGRFLGLAALVSVVLAAVAVAMAARRHSARHLHGSAVMRCLGASQRTLVGIHVGELLFLGLIGSAVGVLFALGLQAGDRALAGRRA